MLFSPPSDLPTGRARTKSRERLTLADRQSLPTHAAWLRGVSNFLRLERFAVAPKAVGFAGVWIRPCARAAVASVKRQQMPTNAYFIAQHFVALRTELILPHP